MFYPQICLIYTVKLFSVLSMTLNFEQTLITARIDGKRARGRQRYNYLDQLKTYTELNTEELLHFVKDRRKWKNICEQNFAI